MATLTISRFDDFYFHNFKKKIKFKKDHKIRHLPRVDKNWFNLSTSSKMRKGVERFTEASPRVVGETRRRKSTRRKTRLHVINEKKNDQERQAMTASKEVSSSMVHQLIDNHMSAVWGISNYWKILPVEEIMLICHCAQLPETQNKTCNFMNLWITWLCQIFRLFIIELKDLTN